MAPLIPATVQVLTRNSAKTIGVCLDALTDFDEVIVQDGGSTDGTREIAAKYPNVKIMDQNRALLSADGCIKDFAAMRNESIRAANHDWIFVVDSSEPVPSSMVEEVRSATQGEPAIYEASRRFFVNGERIEWCSAYPSLQIRLFHRSRTNGYRKAVHERLDTLPGSIIRFFRTELPEEMPPLSELPKKYAHYRRLEYKRMSHLPWSKWLTRVLLRNLRSCIGLLLRTAYIWLLPRKGKRMPLGYEFAYVKQLTLLSIGLCPLILRRRTDLN